MNERLFFNGVSAMLRSTVVALLLLLHTAVYSGETLVRTASGPITGVEAGGVRKYLGIPYAASPAGEMRWKAPEPPARWSDPLACDAFGPACPQNTGGYGKIEPQDEEKCLTMNVWTPAADDGAKLPVLVWIHGGGFCIGASFQKHYEGTQLAKQGLVVVSFNYRLGPLGFLAGKELSAESSTHSSGNYGLLDIVHALKWVKENVQAFGGDPKNVTIMGESAGGAAVAAMMCTPLAKGLFHKAVCMSGSQGTQLRYLTKRQDDMDSMEDFGWEFVKRVNVPHDSKVLETLRALPVADVLAGEKFTSVIPGALTADHVCVDGYVLKEQMHASFAEGNVARVPFITGTVRDEGTIFAGKLKITTLDEMKNFFAEQYPGKGDAALLIYPAENDDGVITALNDFSSDRFFRFAREAARGMAGVSEDTYMYHFNHGPESQKKHPMGIHHGYEIKYFFGNLEGPEFTEVDQAVSKQAMGYLVRFCETGNPNGDGKSKELVTWPAYTLPNEKKKDPKAPVTDEAFLLIDATSQARRAFNHKRLDALDALRN
jgi:para-nitrobenzyl esterase